MSPPPGGLDLALSLELSELSVTEIYLRFLALVRFFNCIFFAENHLDVTLDPWIWILDYVAEEIYNEDTVLLVRGEGKGEVGGVGAIASPLFIPFSLPLTPTVGSRRRNAS